MSELPLYTCHKKVRAAKIGGIGTENIMTEGAKVLWVGEDWIKKHQPEIGGYLVVYEDGYTSYSPAKAFEEGYTKDKE